MEDEHRYHLAFVSDLVPDAAYAEYERHLESILPILVHRQPDYPTLFAHLVDPGYYIDFLVLDIDDITKNPHFNLYEFVDTVRTLIGCSAIYEYPDATTDGPRLIPRQTKIIAMVGLDTPVEVIRQVQKMTAISALTLRLGPGITQSDVDDAVRNYFDGKNIVPPKIASRLRGGRKATATEPSIKLTPRQTQILDLVTTRGASNKVIAKTLKISESTVKLHMSAILKKYGCRNRTQLAVFSRDRVKTLASWLLALFLGAGTLATAQIPDLVPDPVLEYPMISASEVEVLDDECITASLDDDEDLFYEGANYLGNPNDIDYV